MEQHAGQTHPEAGAPQPVPQQPYAQQPYAQQPAPAPKKHGCLKWGCGCLVVLLAFVLIILVVLGWYLRWPEQWGLVDGPGDELFSASPNPWAAEDFEDRFEELGYSTAGLTIYAIPQQDGPFVLYLLAQEAEGFTWSHATFENPMEGLLMVSSAVSLELDWDIEHVAVDYRDASGAQVAVMTGPTQAFIDRATGAISADELFDQMHGRAPDSAPLNISGGGE